MSLNPSVNTRETVTLVDDCNSFPAGGDTNRSFVNGVTPFQPIINDCTDGKLLFCTVVSVDLH